MTPADPPGFRGPAPAPPSVPDHTLLRPVGRGAYGEVWLARNIMGTPRAVKVVRRDAFQDGAPYEREFQGVRHYEPVSRGAESLVHVLHVGRDDAAGLFYYVMELADDEDPAGTALLRRGGSGPDPENYSPRTLRSELKRLGRLPLVDTLDLAASLAAGLEHLHRHRLVHRDIKPSNIIRVHGVPKLADPGLAGVADESRSFVGTEGFVPPEGPGSVRADLYALGKVLYEASTGLDRQRFPEIPADWIGDPSESDRMEFHEIVLRACEGDPARRYPDAASLASDVALLRSGRSLRALRRLERRAAGLRVAALVGALLLAVAGTAWWAARREATRERVLRLQVAAAERDARLRLRQSWIARARAERLAGGLEARRHSLEALAEAERLDPSSRAEPSWVQERTAALALWGARWEPLEGFPVRPVSDPMLTVLDRTHSWIAAVQPDGAVEVGHRGGTTVRLPAPPCGLADQVLEVSSNGLAVRVRSGTREWVGDTASGRWFAAEGRAALMPDGRSFLRMDSTGRPVRVSVPDGTLGEPWRPDPRACREWSLLSVSPSGQRLAAVDASRRRVVLWDPESGSTAGEIPTPHPATALAWSTTGRRIAVGTFGGAVLVSRLPDTEPVWTRVLHAGPIRGITLDAEGARLLSMGEDEQVHLVDAVHGIDLGNGGWNSWNAGFGPDGRTVGPVASDGTNGRLRLDDAVGLLRVRPRGQPGSDGALAWSPDGSALYGTSEGGLEAWTADGEPLGSWSVPAVDRLKAEGTRVWYRSPDGIGRIAAGKADAVPERVRRGAAATDFVTLGSAVGEPALALADGPEERIRLPDGGPAEATLERPDRLAAAGGWLAAASATVGDVRVWSVSDGRLLRTLPASPHSVPAFDAAGRWLVVADRSPRLWDTRDWSWRPLPGGGPRTVAGPSPDGRYVAVVVAEREIHRLTLPDLRPRIVLEGPVGIRLVSLTISPDGRRLAAQGLRGEILVWDTAATDPDAATSTGMEH